MIALVLTLMLSMQGGPVVPQGGGTVTDVLRTETGAPASPGTAALRLDPVTLPVVVTVEGGGKIPVSADGKPATIRFTPVGGGKDLETALNSTGIAVPVSQGVVEEYRVSIESLPSGYAVKSITFGSITTGSTDLISETLKASPASLAPVVVPRVNTFGGAGELQRAVDQAMQRAVGVKLLAITLALDPRS